MDTETTSQETIPICSRMHPLNGQIQMATVMETIGATHHGTQVDYLFGQGNLLKMQNWLTIALQFQATLLQMDSLVARMEMVTASQINTMM